jgi:hypothetical protein
MVVQYERPILDKSRLPLACSAFNVATVTLPPKKISQASLSVIRVSSVIGPAARALLGAGTVSLFSRTSWSSSCSSPGSALRNESKSLQSSVSLDAIRAMLAGGLASMVAPSGCSSSMTLPPMALAITHFLPHPHNWQMLLVAPPG